MPSHVAVAGEVMLGEHEKTGFARSFELDISECEQHSSIKHDICCGGMVMVHQVVKWHIGLSISPLSTYNDLCEQIINCSQARRTWTVPNVMHVDQVHLIGGQHVSAWQGQGQGRQG